MTKTAVDPAELDDVYLARDPENPALCAWWRCRENGRSTVVAGGFRSDAEARRWLSYHRPDRDPFGTFRTES